MANRPNVRLTWHFLGPLSAASPHTILEYWAYRVFFINYIGRSNVYVLRLFWKIHCAVCPCHIAAVVTLVEQVGLEVPVRRNSLGYGMTGDSLVLASSNRYIST